MPIKIGSSQHWNWCKQPITCQNFNRQSTSAEIHLRKSGSCYQEVWGDMEGDTPGKTQLETHEEKLRDTLGKTQRRRWEHVSWPILRRTCSMPEEINFWSSERLWPRPEQVHHWRNWRLGETQAGTGTSQKRLQSMQEPCQRQWHWQAQCSREHSLRNEKSQTSQYVYDPNLLGKLSPQQENWNRLT